MVGEIHGGSYVNGERVAGRQSLGEGQSLTRMTISMIGLLLHLQNIRALLLGITSESGNHVVYLWCPKSLYNLLLGCLIFR
jgi:hypothetical protein